MGNLKDEKNEGEFDNPTFEGDDDKGFEADKGHEAGKGHEADKGHETDKGLEFSNTSFDPIDIEPSKPKDDRIRIMKNVGVICFSFTFVFTAYQSMASLQSSINPDAGLGTYSLAVVYGSLVISSCFLPTILIKKLTVKWTLCFCQFGYSLYIAAQFWPEYYTLMPAAVIVGFCAAPMWSAKCTYLTHVGHTYAKMAKDNAEVIIVRFFGIFFLAFQAATVWGNLISSAVLSSDEETVISDEDLEQCGIMFCPVESGENSNNTNLEPPPKSKIYTLATVYLVSSIVGAIIIALLLDPLTRWGEGDRGGDQGKSGKELLISTFKQLRHPYQMLIVPLTMWSGLEQGFWGSEFTRAFISCAYGTEHIGYIMICYGAVDAVMSITFGPVIRYCGRIPVFLIGALSNVAGLVLMYRWAPNPDEAYMFYIIAAIWGIGDAVWQTQINAFYGVLFPGREEAAFSNYRLWESMGFIIAYILNNVTCTHPHACVITSFLALGMVCYGVIEILQRYRPQTYPESKHQEPCDNGSLPELRGQS